jgi:methionyl-tRNA synthetase
MENKKFYITTTLPYINDLPHIGFALEIIQADVIARLKKQEGFDVFFNTGTDEHGVKIYRKALEKGKSPEEYADEMVVHFKKLKDILNLSFNNFIRTTEEHHILAAQKFWEICKSNGDIYKGIYKAKYCAGCEMEKTDSELEEGRCPIHPKLEIEIIEEENYFFRFSRYQKELLNLYEKYPDFVLPSHRLEEIKNFVKSGLQDFSISRLKEKMPWGIPVPGDEKHVMYVWFDALVNYVSALGWPEDREKFTSFWGSKENPQALQIAGKDNLRQQAAMWQAMLLSAKLPTSRQILIHGFILSEGMRMSKSLGNVVNPFEIVEKYGSDALRYYLLREISTFEDGDFSMSKFENKYKGDLAHGLGNFVARILSLAQGLTFENQKVEESVKQKIEETRKRFYEKCYEYKFNEALTILWELIGFGDKLINEKKLWLIKEIDERKKEIFSFIFLLDEIAYMLYPFLPSASSKISSAIYKEGGKILKTKNIDILFPKK